MFNPDPGTLLELPADLHLDFDAPRRLRQQGGAYLCSNSMGIIPLSAIKAERECLEAEAARGISVWDEGDWMGVLQRYASVIARYSEARPDQVCPVTNITDGIWRSLTSLELRPDRPILQTSMAFTTQLYADFGLERLGARVVTVPADTANHRVPTGTLVEAIRQHRPAVVHLSHAAFESGWLIETDAVANACREVDAIFLLDAAQTGFLLPVTLENTGADVLLFQQHKWGCAGTGAACMVASDRFLERATPALLGWMSHASPFAFERGPARPADGAWRFVGGTPDVPSKARGAVAAEIIVDRLGIHAVCAHNRSLMTSLLEGLRELSSLRGDSFMPIEQPRRAGFVVVECGSTERADAIVHALHRRQIIIDNRGSRLRIGPTFYNTGDDINALLAGLHYVTRGL